MSSLWAKEKNDLEIALTAQSVVRDVSGQESLVANVSVEPGDVVAYTAVYRNHGAQPLRQLVPTLPVPAGMEFIAGSAQPAPATASLDGKKFEPYPIRRTHKLADGREVTTEIPVSAYRALRWSAGDLSPKDALTVVIRARVSTNAPASR